jgi:hypothetical protein
MQVLLCRNVRALHVVPPLLQKRHILQINGGGNFLENFCHKQPINVLWQTANPVTNFFMFYATCLLKASAQKLRCTITYVCGQALRLATSWTFLGSPPGWYFRHPSRLVPWPTEPPVQRVPEPFPGGRGAEAWRWLSSPQLLPWLTKGYSSTTMPPLCLHGM